MLYLILFIIEIIVIFFLSKRVQRVLSGSLMHFTGNKKLTIYTMAFLFLPGTFIHEASHFLAALFLLVPVGNMQLIPEIEDEGVKLGSVSIAKTDPIRRFIIGVAPLFIGIGIICSIFSFYSFTDLLNNWVIDLLVFYIVFTISNSMFSSRKDMEGLWGFLFIITTFLVSLWFLGIRADFTLFFDRAEDIFKPAALFLTIPILIDVLALSFLPKR